MLPTCFRYLVTGNKGLPSNHICLLIFSLRDLVGFAQLGDHEQILQRPQFESVLEAMAEMRIEKAGVNWHPGVRQALASEVPLRDRGASVTDRQIYAAKPSGGVPTVNQTDPLS